MISIDVYGGEFRWCQVLSALYLGGHDEKKMKHLSFKVDGAYLKIFFAL